MNSLKSLERKIFIYNEYARVAAPILEFIKEVSKEFIGKKIVTQKGLAAKYAEAVKIERDEIKVKPIPGTNWAKLYYVSVSQSYNSLTVEIKLCFSNGDGGSIYESNTYYFGDMEGDILKSVNDEIKISLVPFDFKTELAAIKKYRELEALAKDAEDKIRVALEDYKYISLEDLEN